MLYYLKTTTSKQLKEIHNKTNSENRHLVFLIFKKKQEKEYKMSIFGICFILYYLKHAE